MNLYKVILNFQEQAWVPVRAVNEEEASILALEMSKDLPGATVSKVELLKENAELEQSPLNKTLN